MALFLYKSTTCRPTIPRQQPLLRWRGNPDAQRHNQGRLATREEISQRIKTHASNFSRQFTIVNSRGVQAKTTENTVKFLNSWSLHEGMGKCIKHFEKGVIYISFANQDITNHTIVKYFLMVLKKTGKYQQATKTEWLATTPWRHGPTARISGGWST